jgi:hypothetical protein
MVSRTPTLAEWPYGIARLACGLCPSRGQYRKGTLIARFGSDVKMPDLRHLTAECRDGTLQAKIAGLNYFADLLGSSQIFVDIRKSTCSVSVL